MVSDRPGTTRDVIEVALELGGLPVVLSDTAGLRDAEDELEREGVRRALSRARQADLVLLLRDAAGPSADVRWGDAGDAPILRVANKVDLGVAQGAGEIGISARTGEGLDALIEAVAAVATGALTGDGSPALTRARHRAALQDALASVARSREAPTPELRAEDLRLAVRAIGRITGRVDVEDVLDVVFSAFCIGK
jgi:tRNA modification GTPase